MINTNLENRRFKAITFDCYGTLIDWESGAMKYLSAILKRAHSSVPTRKVFERWEEIQFIYLQDPYEPYREILFHSLLDTLDELKIPYRDGDGDGFGEDIGNWQPFPDVPSGLARLKKHFKLGIISNVDDDIVAQSLSYMGTAIDFLITAERAGFYKPDPEPFKLAIELIGLPPADILHAAFGYKYDLRPASELGMSTCFVNRSGLALPEGFAPDLIVTSIADLAEALQA